MKKYILLLLTGGSFFYEGQAQSTQQVIGAGGGSSKALAGYTIDFTVGETVILTAGTNPACTEGFHQPLIARDLPDSNLINVGWYIKVFPNPMHDQLKIHAYMDKSGDLDFRLIDMQGRGFLVRRISFGQGYNDALLYVGSLARGIYVLTIADHVHGGHREVKLLKE